MSVVTGQVVSRVFTTKRHDTGTGVNADSLPTGTLYLNGTADGATVTVTNITTGRYKAVVTMPTLVVGDCVDLVLTEVINSITASRTIWSDGCDIALDSSSKVQLAAAQDTVTFAAVNVTKALAISDGVSITVTTSDRTAIYAKGNGIGSGLGAYGGDAGNGISGSGGASGGSGIAGTTQGGSSYYGIAAFGQFGGSALGLVGSGANSLYANSTISLNGIVTFADTVTFSKAVSANITSLGTGSRVLTLTVTDGTDPIQGARVRIYLNAADNQVGTTNSSGVVTFSACGDGAYTLAISYPGYTFTPVSLTVSANVTATYAMTAINFAASEPGFVTGTLIAYDGDGEPLAGVDFTIQPYDVGTTTGAGLLQDWVTITSTTGGATSFPNLIPGVTYRIRRGEARRIYAVTIPTDAEGTYSLPSVIGL